jgi:hypothetical protein
MNEPDDCSFGVGGRLDGRFSLVLRDGLNPGLGDRGKTIVREGAFLALPELAAGAIVGVTAFRWSSHEDTRWAVWVRRIGGDAFSSRRCW